ADAGTGLFSLEQLTGHVDGNNDIQITWACNPPTPNGGTPPPLYILPAAGAGCSDATKFGITNYVAMSGVTSANPRSEFALGPKYGTLTCFEQTTRADATLTIPAMAAKTFLGTQTGGSMQLLMMNIEAAAILASPKQLQAAGHGQFAFIPH